MITREEGKTEGGNVMRENPQRKRKGRERVSESAEGGRKRDKERRGEGEFEAEEWRKAGEKGDNRRKQAERD